MLKQQNSVPRSLAGPYDLCRSRGSAQSSCQESVSLLGKCCVLSEEGRRYKISLQALVWRNSEPKYIERLKRRGRGKTKNKKRRREKRGRKPAKGILGERSLCRGSSTCSPAKGGEGRQRLDGHHQLCVPELLWCAPEPAVLVLECLCLCVGSRARACVCV